MKYIMKLRLACACAIYPAADCSFSPRLPRRTSRKMHSLLLQCHMKQPSLLWSRLPAIVLLKDLH